MSFHKFFYQPSHNSGTSDDDFCDCTTGQTLPISFINWSRFPVVKLIGFAISKAGLHIAAVGRLGPRLSRLGRWRSSWPDSKNAAIKLSQFRVTCLIFPSTLGNDVARHVSMTPKKCQRCIVIIGRERLKPPLTAARYLGESGSHQISERCRGVLTMI